MTYTKISKMEMWNDSSFSSDDLFRLADISASATDNEKFLISMIDRFFIKIALLQDDVDSYKSMVDELGGRA